MSALHPDPESEIDWIRGVTFGALMSERLRHLVDALTKAK